MGALADIFRRHGPAYRAQYADRMPADQVNKLSDAMRKVAQTPTMKKRLLDLGVVATWESPQDFTQHIVTEFERNKKIYADAGIQPE